MDDILFEVVHEFKRGNVYYGYGTVRGNDGRQLPYRGNRRSSVGDRKENLCHE